MFAKKQPTTNPHNNTHFPENFLGFALNGQRSRRRLFQEESFSPFLVSLSGLLQLHLLLQLCIHPCSSPYQAARKADIGCTILRTTDPRIPLPSPTTFLPPPCPCCWKRLWLSFRESLSSSTVDGEGEAGRRGHRWGGREKGKGWGNCVQLTAAKADGEGRRRGWRGRTLEYQGRRSRPSELRGRDPSSYPCPVVAEAGVPPPLQISAFARSNSAGSKIPTLPPLSSPSAAGVELCRAPRSSPAGRGKQGTQALPGRFPPPPSTAAAGEEEGAALGSGAEICQAGSRGRAAREAPVVRPRAEAADSPSRARRLLRQPAGARLAALRRGCFPGHGR
ncbi:tetratricopeptide repeat protein 29 [Platysternon megacephalum]|uniref:Tetratricopeptide repeat protein 29 n=1 Tax=Platysternon megacephalum TaxID=55544 RepID=A0A4D9F038_9SAUR|nr:tetratricopeptide repeat protein 29 [Platysternon megacephalum]